MWLAARTIPEEKLGCFFLSRVSFGGNARSTGGCFDVVRTRPQAGVGKFDRGQLIYRDAVYNKLRETVT